jgi:hypothetical protein
VLGWVNLELRLSKNKTIDKHLQDQIKKKKKKKFKKNKKKKKKQKKKKKKKNTTLVNVS